MNDELTLKAALERIANLLIGHKLPNSQKVEQAFCAAKCALARHKMHKAANNEMVAVCHADNAELMVKAVNEMEEAK